ncbi:hypothetical protein CFT13S00388_07970 [Campylobacter fetus subsp. testudinum]|uniref:hypothetical protein n=1 Tax=Campylobacter fetus TaxID=196 RepID=UPI00081899F0|nr:hypothetical protein [Campylobacter fetus]OCR86682.1 hypothetical protein CFT13S00388_07970 [Campylobacter fetus subsp. testudinum]
MEDKEIALELTKLISTNLQTFVEIDTQNQYGDKETKDKPLNEQAVELANVYNAILKTIKENA